MMNLRTGLFLALLSAIPAALVAQVGEENHVAPDRKTEAQVDYPADLWMQNIGSKIDGSGMCVFTSAEMAAIWAGHDEFRGFRDWCASHYPGGGYPEKLDKLIAAYCKAKSIQVPGYIQYEGQSMDIAAKALRNGQMVCSTLYRSPRYGSGIIYHMVNLAHWGPGNYGAIQDNNFRPYEWDTVSGMEPRLKQGGRVWLMVWKRHGPPPPPK
jgi:hypothetical protein